MKYLVAQKITKDQYSGDLNNLELRLSDHECSHLLNMRYNDLDYYTDNFNIQRSEGEFLVKKVMSREGVRREVGLRCL